MPKFLFKANDDVISHCRCQDEPAMSTGQLDCPWCGCGWLISCSKCAKAFTYGVVRETDIPIIELGRREVRRRGLASVSEEEIEEWADAMEREFARFEIGQIVVYLDGHYWPLDAENVTFEGYFARHDLKLLPHAEALERPEALSDLLSDRAYWLDRELPDRE